MFCVNCGNEIEEGTKFCTRCGHKVPETQPSPVNAARTEENAVPETVKAQAEEPVKEAVPEAAEVEIEAAEEPIEAQPQPETEIPPHEPVMAAPVKPEQEKKPERQPERKPEAEKAPARESREAPARQPEGEPVYRQPVAQGAYQPAQAAHQYEPAAAQAAHQYEPAAAQAAHPVTVVVNQGTYQPEQQTAAKRGAKKPPETGKQRAASAAVSVILALLLFAFLTSATAVTILNVSLAPDSLTSTVQDMDVANMDISGVVGGEETTVADYAYDLVRDMGWEDISRRDVEEMVEKPFVANFVSEMSQEYMSALSGNGKSDGLNADRVVDYIKDHEDEIQEAAADAGFEGELYFDYDRIEREVDDIVGDKLEISSIEENNSLYFKLAKLVFSKVVFIGLWVVTALLCVLIILANKRRVSRALTYIGIPTLIIGLTALIASAAVSLFLDMDSKTLIKLLYSLAGNTVLMTGIIMTAIGVVFIAVRIIVRSVRKRMAINA